MSEDSQLGRDLDAYHESVHKKAEADLERDLAEAVLEHARKQKRQRKESKQPWTPKQSGSGFADSVPSED